MVDAGGVPPQPQPVPYRPARATALLGYHIPPREQARILRRLECAVLPFGWPPSRDVITGPDGVEDLGMDNPDWAVAAPTFRPDLIREVDLIEEVGRIAGYGMAPETLPRHTTAGGLTQPQQVRRAVRRALAGCGLDEVITYSFIAPDALSPLGLPEGDVRLEPVRLSNPMSVEQSVMRTMLLPGLLKTVRDNVDRLNDPPNLFEIGKVYLWDEPVPAPEHAAEPGAVLPHEPEALGIVLSGPLVAENWTGAGRATDFYTLKGAVDAALAAVGLRGEYAPLGDAAAQFPFLHPGKAALVSVPGAGGVGALGQLRPDVAAACGIDDLAVYYASLTMDRIAPAALATPAFADLGTYPPATQDLAVVVGREVPAEAVVAQAGRAGGKLVRSVRVFDVYEGDQVAVDKRSLALRVVMRAPDRTLNEKDIAGVRAKILKALEREFQATLR
jgi:phenylalanyl-tRNA synthetase beta chain